MRFWDARVCQFRHARKSTSSLPQVVRNVNFVIKCWFFRGGAKEQPDLDNMNFEAYRKELAKNPELKKAREKDFWDRICKHIDQRNEQDNGREM